MHPSDTGPPVFLRLIRRSESTLSAKCFRVRFGRRDLATQPLCLHSTRTLTSCPICSNRRENASKSYSLRRDLEFQQTNAFYSGWWQFSTLVSSYHRGIRADLNRKLVCARSRL